MESIVFDKVTPTDESSFQSYAVWMSATQIANLYDSGQIGMDKEFQRGFVQSPDKSSRGRLIPVHDRPANRKHISSISADLGTTEGLLGRTKAVIPPIWLNVRLGDTSSDVHYKPLTGTLEVCGMMYVVDGYHRVKAIFDAWLNKRINPERKFLTYITYGPKSFEAYLFNLLNGESLKVDTTRIAWVSAPFEEGHRRLVYEMALKSKNLSRLDSTGEREFNFETARSTSPMSSTTYTNFRVLVEGLKRIQGTTNIPVNESILEQLQGEACSNPTTRDLLSTYMAQYWDALCNVRPELGFHSIKDRQKTKKDVPYLCNKVTARALMWLGIVYLSAYQPAAPDAGLQQRLKEITTDPSIRHRLFITLGKLNKGKDAKGKVVDFFSSENTHWAPSATESQKFTKDSMTDRAFPLQRILSAIGPLKPNTLTCRHIETLSSRGRIAQRELEREL